jgi:hypothetical protein
MAQQPTKGFQADKNADGALKGANGINQSDGDHEVDDEFESIGFLAGTILSRVKARKEATGANDLAPVARHAQATGGVVASNGKRSGGAVRVVTVLADLPIMPQQPPVTQTKDTTTKYRAYKRSAGS